MRMRFYSFYQSRIFILSVMEILGRNSYPHISVLDFSWFPASAEQAPSLTAPRKLNPDIKIKFSMSNPYEKLTGSYHYHSSLTCEARMRINSFAQCTLGMGTLFRETSIGKHRLCHSICCSIYLFLLSFGFIAG